MVYVRFTSYETFIEEIILCSYSRRHLRLINSQLIISDIQDFNPGSQRFITSRPSRAAIFVVYFQE